MFTNSCFVLIRIVSSAKLVLSFAGVCLILLTISVHPARGQGTQEEFQPSAFLHLLQYQTLLSQTNIAFIEFSGSRDIDDPLDDFVRYVIDPINWNPSEPIERRMVYRTHAGFQTRRKILSGTSSLRFGLETQMEHTHVYSIPGSGAGQSTSEQHQNLVDAVYAPYLILESQPLSWIRMLGNLRLNVLALDVQHGCPKTCSLEPKGQGINMAPSFKGGLLFGPWFNTQVFINLGKGFHRLDEREPVGSTGEQQINRTRFVEFGFLTDPGEHVEIQGSLWGTKNDSDFFYNFEDEEFVTQGSSHRYGVNLEARIWLPQSTTLTGGITVSRNTFQQTQQPIPLTPQLTGHATLHRDWYTNWSTTLQWQYIGKRRSSRQSFPVLHTLDMLVQYHLPRTGDTGDLTASWGIVNLLKHRSPSSLFYFDSGLTPDRTPAIDINYFPSQPRTIVAGISWLF